MSSMFGKLARFTRGKHISRLNSGYFYRRHHCASSSDGVPAKSEANDIRNIPLTEPVSWIPPSKYANIANQKQETRVTVLDNGLRVASEQKFGHFSTVGVLIDSGSRYEVAYPSGISHFLEKLAYASTSKFENKDTALQTLEKHGGICDCQGSRVPVMNVWDTLIYAMSARTTGLPDVIELLSEAVLRPQITEQEVAECRAIINFELEALDMRPDPEPLLVEMIHAAAYRDNTLGLPKICPRESVNVIDRKTLMTYISNYHTLDRMVLAGVGVDHDKLVELASKHFTKKPVWSEEKNSSLIDPRKGHDLSLSQYTGGRIELTKDLSAVSLGPTPMPELAHIVIGLESCSHKDADFVAFCVLNMMMGGGGSFSAGGPGKGMYTRLYLNVLNRFHWIHNATAYNHAYSDSGLFCIHASADPSSLKDLVEVIVKELVNTQHGVSDSELNRAKTQLQSMLMMNLETRPVMFEDIGRQVLSTGRRQQSQYYCNLIDKITAADITRVAQRMIRSRPSVAALGNLSLMPSYEDIMTALGSKDGKMSLKRFSLFR